jgi:hypothetical protein
MNDTTNFLKWCDRNDCYPTSDLDQPSVGVEHLTAEQRSELWSMPGYKVISASAYTVWLVRVK